MIHRLQIEYVLGLGFLLLIPAFLIGALATYLEHAVGLVLVFASFGVAGLTWIRQELPEMLYRLAEMAGLIDPPTA